jgi:hypothetical protein
MSNLSTFLRAGADTQFCSTCLNWHKNQCFQPREDVKKACRGDMTEEVIWGFKQDFTKNRDQLGFQYNICQVCDEYHLTALEYFEESDDEEEDDRYECVQCSAMLPKGLIGFCDMECRNTYAKEYRPIIFKK